MKQSIKQRLVDHIKSSFPGWISKGEMTDGTEWYYYEKGIKKRYLAETVGRQLRDAEEESMIARKDDGISCQYKFLPPTMRSRYIPWSKRTIKSKLFKDQ